jgi:hypothetical protein
MNMNLSEEFIINLSDVLFLEITPYFHLAEGSLERRECSLFDRGTSALGMFNIRDKRIGYLFVLSLMG